MPATGPPHGPWRPPTTSWGQADAANGLEPAWIDLYHHARLSVDATEVFRDLKIPKAVLGWDQQANSGLCGARVPPLVHCLSFAVRLSQSMVGDRSEDLPSWSRLQRN